jgi:hypothetical protein
MKLLTQNSDLKKSGIYGWTLPAHWVTLSNGDKFNTCPNAGICAGFCYAKNGTYNFKNVKKAHIEKLELVLYNREGWIKLMNEELSNKKYIGKYIRIHDAGDFFNLQYAKDWIEIAKNNKQCIFYAYTKEVKMFKSIELPDNFIVIYSYGGKEDNLIDKENDRHSDVFHNYNKMIEKGYNDIADDDKQAAININHKVGLYRNNIKHFIKKMGNNNFSNFKKNKNETKQD